MKKSLIALCLALGGNLAAQTSIALSIPKTSVAIVANQTLFENAAPYQQIKTTIDVKNTSAVTHTYHVVRYDIKLNSAGSGDDAMAYFCFAGQCYDNTVFVSGAPLILDAGQSASSSTMAFTMLDADYWEASVAGLSVVKYTFYDVSNRNDSIQITFRYNDLQVVGIKQAQNKKANIAIYPNPAADYANISIEGNGDASKLTVLSSIGELVYEKELSASEKTNVKLNVQNLAAGVYFVQVKAGTTLTTKKLVVD